MSSSGTESDSSASSDVDFDDYGEFGYQLEPEYTEELRQMEEAASAQRREIENNPRQNDTNWCSCSKCISLYLCRRNACAAMNFHCLMVSWNPVTALPITPTLEQFVSTLLCLKQAILVFGGTNITEEELQMC